MQMKIHRKYRNGTIKGVIWGLLGMAAFAACQKIEYTTMDSPAYLRVFNSLNYFHVMETKGDTLPYFCMLINPEFDANGIPVGAEVVGDFLDVRDKYAPPYPSHIGVSTNVDNPEYPGKADVLVGPVLNGFDLSSWAQVPSGEARFLFIFRPKSDVPFFELPESDRQHTLVDTTLRMDAGEVYTMNLLTKDFYAKRVGVLLRQENFHKLSLSDSLVYVNFYNYSAEGYWQADISLKAPTGQYGDHFFVQGIRDTMNVYLTLMESEEVVSANLNQSRVYVNANPISTDFTNMYFYTLMRDNESSAVKPYQSFPLWATGNGVYTAMWQRFHFLSYGQDASKMANYTTYSSYRIDRRIHNGSLYAAVNCLLNGPYIAATRTYVDANYGHHWGVNFPNLVVNTHSGTDNPRSFATVNTIEVINGEAYLMTIQRKYAAPIY